MNRKRSQAQLLSSHPSLIVLANRAPFTHQRTSDGDIRQVRSASGLVTAIEPLVEALSGTWVAHGEATDLRAADRAGRVAVRQGGLRYHLRYVPVPDDEYQGFYGGFANEALWPLCHSAGVQPAFRDGDFRSYRNANRRFASAVIDEAAGRSPYVLVQDYHFALAPRMIRKALGSSPIVSFWHIPWPEPDAFTLCPWNEDLLRGLLGSDVIGLQTDADCERFLASAALMECDVDFTTGTVNCGGRSTRVRAYPVGVQVDACSLLAIPPAAECRAQVFNEYGLPATAQLGVGVDRLDYSKGIPEKFRAIERLLDSTPELHGRFSFIQVAEPSRVSLTAYRQLRATVADICARVNARFATESWTPITLVDRHLDAPAIYRLYRAADLCFVNSLADGMNLVAKEYAASREDERGVLVLSEQAGAMQQLRAALPVDPHRVEDTAKTLGVALAMSPGEQRRRMRALRVAVAAADCYWWADQLLSAVAAPDTQPLYWPSDATSLRLTTF